MKKALSHLAIAGAIILLAIATGEKDITPAAIPFIIGIYYLFNKEAKTND